MRRPAARSSLLEAINFLLRSLQRRNVVLLDPCVIEYGPALRRPALQHSMRRGRVQGKAFNFQATLKTQAMKSVGLAPAGAPNTVPILQALNQ
jgi:hypothetical protein